ncbi:MAG: tetratricopeptide repeat protein, partial [Planctomycetales bacterium]|nr:tetratricopeptide repeat protein [Planctomycetales bacterium]
MRAALAMFHTALITMALAAIVGEPPIAEAQQPAPTTPTTGAPKDDAEGAGPKSSPAAVAAYSDIANLQNNGEFAVAVDDWKKFLLKHGKEPIALQAHHNLGVCLMQTNQLVPAAQEFQLVVKNGGTEEFVEEAYLNLGWCQYSQGIEGNAASFKAAAETFARQQQAFPQGKLLPQALFYRAESLYMQDEPTAATPLYEQIVEKFADSDIHADAMYALAVSYQEAGEHKKATVLFNRFLDDYGDHAMATEVKMRKAEVMADTGDFAAASTLFAEVIASPDFPAADHAIFRRAHCESMLGHYPAAAELYTKLVETHANSSYVPEATIAAGRSLFHAEQWDDAVAWFKKVLNASTPFAPEAAHWTCRILIKQQQGGAAEKLAIDSLASYQKTAPDNPFVTQLQLDRADAVYAIADRRGESLPLYVQFVKDHKDHESAPQALYNAAFAAMELGQYDQAIKLTEQFEKGFAGDRLAPDVLYVRAESELLGGDAEAAANTYDKLIQEHSDHAHGTTWVLRRGLALFLLKQYQSAIELLRPTIEKLTAAEDRAEALFLIGSSMRQLKQNEQAVQTLEAALSASPNGKRSGEIQLELANARGQAQTKDAAIEELKSMIANAKPDAVLDRAHYQLAEYAYANGQLPLAIENYSIVLDKWPDSALATHARYGKGWAQLRSGALEDAVKTLSQLIEADTTTSLAQRALLARGMCRQQLKQYEAAAQDIREFLATSPKGNDRADALYVQGLSLVGQQKLDDAIETFRNLLAEHRDYGQADKVRYELGWALQSAGNREEAIAEFQQLATLFPDSNFAPEANYHIAEAAYDARQYDAALKSYQIALDRADNADLSEKAAYKLGWTYYKMEDFNKAIASFEQQLQFKQNETLSSDGAFMLGECLFKLEKHDQALSAFENAKKLKPSSDTVAVLLRLHAGQSAAQMKKLDQAAAYLQEVISQYASNS